MLVSEKVDGHAVKEYGACTFEAECAKENEE